MTREGDSYLVSHDEGLSIRRPRQRKGITQALHLIEARLCSHVPELDDTIATNAAQLGILCGIKSYLLHRRRVAFELSGKFHMRFVRIPCITSKVSAKDFQQIERIHLGIPGDEVTYRPAMFCLLPLLQLAFPRDSMRLTASYSRLMVSNRLESKTL